MRSPAERTCANCGADIPWRPVLRAGQPFCCAGCAQGGPCVCSYDDVASCDKPPPRELARASGGASGLPQRSAAVFIPSQAGPLGKDRS